MWTIYWIHLDKTANSITLDEYVGNFIESLINSGGVSAISVVKANA